MKMRYMPTPSKEVIDSVLAQITDSDELNSECRRYALDMMGLSEFQREMFDENRDPQAPMFWEHYASRTREIILLALVQL